MKECIIFDFDGTVMNTGPGIMDAARYALSKHGIVDDRELRFFVGPPLFDTFYNFYNMSDQEAVQAVQDYREYYRPIGIYNSVVYDGMAELLKALSKSGRKLAIATSKPIDMARMLLEKAGILSYFNYTCGTSGQAKDNLTKSQLIAAAMEALGGTADNTVVVGDTKYDVSGAHENGIPAIGANYGYAGENELKNAGALYVAENVSELSEILFMI